MRSIDVTGMYPTAQTGIEALGSAAHRSAPATFQTPARKRWIGLVNQPLRITGYYLGLIYAFIIFSQFHELLTMALGVETHILILVGVPMILLVLAGDGLRSTLRWTAAKFWVGYSLWMVIATPFSSWRGASVTLTWNWFRAEVPILFVIAGLVMTWREVKGLMSVLAWAAIVDVVAGRIFSNQIAGRFEMTGTTMSNSNDFAAQLILVLPFLLLVVVSQSRLMFIRIAAAGILLYGLYLVLLTGSRGALIAICISILFYLWRVRFSQKILAASLVLLVVFAVPIVVPQRTLVRLSTTFSPADSSERDANAAGAAESTQSRNYLLRQSILITLGHPVFGVGAGQFSNYEGNTSRRANLHGNWHETHNSFTQVSSEIGVPALLFFLGAIVTTYRMLNSVFKAAGRRAETRESQQIKVTAFCLLISLVGFCTAIFFLSLAYRFYLPALTGVTISFYRAVQEKWRAAPARSDNLELSA
jgi:O-antigen ligase